MTIAPSNPVWLEIEEWAKWQIAAAHRELEQWPTPPGQADLNRGRIRALRDLLNLTSPAQRPEIPESPSY